MKAKNYKIKVFTILKLQKVVIIIDIVIIISFKEHIKEYFSIMEFVIKDSNILT